LEGSYEDGVRDGTAAGRTAGQREGLAQGRAERNAMVGVVALIVSVIGAARQLAPGAPPGASGGRYGADRTPRGAGVPVSEMGAASVEALVRGLHDKIDVVLVDSRTRRNASSARCGSMCWAEAPGREPCSLNAATLQCMPPSVLDGSAPLLYSDMTVFVECVFAVLSRDAQCVGGAKYAVQFVVRECWRFAKTWATGVGGREEKSAANISSSAALRSWSMLEPLAFCVVFVGASCRVHLAAGALTCCQGGE